MTAQRAIHPFAIAGVALLCASLFAITPIRLTAPSLPEVQESAVELTAVAVPDVPTYDYIFGSEIPELTQTVTAYYQSEFAELGDIWQEYFTSLSSADTWTDAEAAMTTLNTDVLDWINEVNTQGLNFIESMDPPVDGVYPPSLCNIITNLAVAGNAWLADLNGGFSDGIAEFNNGVAQFWDGVDSFWAAFPA